MIHNIAVFDLDGTLLDTLDDLANAVNHALANAGFPLRSRDEVRAFVGNGVELLIRRALPAGTDEATVCAVLTDFKRRYAAECAACTAPYAGVLSMLTALEARGVRIAVVSNKFDAAVKALCAQYFGDLVEVAVGEREAAGIRKKPAPDTVFEALAAFGVRQEDIASGRARVTYIGDSEVDIETARNAGIPCISVTWGFRDRACLLAGGATCLVDHPADVTRILTTD